jgi:membrane fusion protein (multidrug efflux system)
MKAKRMIIMLVASAVVFGGVFGFVSFKNAMIKQYFATMPKPVVAVTTVLAERMDWQGSVSAVGTLQAVNGVDISASLSGLVKEIAFQSGQEVKRGQLLLRLDSEVEQSDLRSAQADQALAHITFDRNKTLLRSDTVSQSALDKAEAEYKVKVAKSAGLQAQIAKKSVYAPFDGVLGVRKVDLGQYLQPGQTIVNLQDLSLLLCDFSVSQKDLSLVTPGQPVRMTSDAWPGQVFEGEIAALEPQVDAKTGMMGVQARFPNAERRLRPGMFAKIEITRSQVDPVVVVPAAAITYALHGDAVFVVRENPGADGKTVLTVERAVVELGERQNGVVVVKKGIAAGDRVVTSGQVKLENGSLVQIAAEDPLKAPGKTALQ